MPNKEKNSFGSAMQTVKFSLLRALSTYILKVLYFLLAIFVSQSVNVYYFYVSNSIQCNLANNNFSMKHEHLRNNFA